MSKEHAYAYEAGYRDGSINYELEHCPACKNVADLQEALAENAKLRGQYEAVIDDYRSEVAKLRELCGYLLPFAKSCGAEHPLMHELGIEVDG